MLPITEKMIMSQYSKKTSYQKGLFYFFSGLVSDFKYDEKNNKITACVNGGKKYNVEILFSPDGEILKSVCDCPSYENYLGGCKHCIAVLKYAQCEYNKQLKQSVYEENYAENIMKYFENYFTVQEGSKKALNVKYCCEYNLNNSSNYCLSLKIGLEKFYVVKNIKDLIYAINENQSICYGKAFTFNPKLHRFSQTDEEVISIISELLNFEVNFFDSGYSYLSNFKGKTLNLPSKFMLKIFNCLKDKTIDLTINGIEYENTPITAAPLPLSFKVEDCESSRFCLKIENMKKLIPLAKDCSCFFYDKKIYLLDKKQQEILKPFMKAADKKIDCINFKNTQREAFISQILPIIQDNYNTQISPSIQNNIISEDLNIEIYFDFLDNILTAKVKFIYGVYSINPFGSEKNPMLQNKILLRNSIKENSVMEIFEGSNFLVNKDFLYIENSDKILEFIYNCLPQLQNLANIYYSDSFKNIRITENSSFSVGFKFNMSTFTIDMDINCKDIPAEELNDIFNSYIIKKKYYKLKNGEFIPLNQELFSHILNILDTVDISVKDLSHGCVNLPANRALYLSEKFKHTDKINVKSEPELENFIKNVTYPINADFLPPKETAQYLRPYQLVGFKWLKTLAHYRLGGILADDMGLGKTLQTITFLLSQKEEKYGLNIVVCPTSLVYNWVDEINKFAPSLNILVICGNAITRQELLKDIKDIDLIITSYPLIRRDIDLYENIEFEFCFLDEAQNIKNPNSLNAVCVKRLKAKGYFALTGTPIENSLSEIWSIFDFIMPGYLFSHNKFIKKYERPIIKEQNHDILNELSTQIKPFILRRMKKDVLSELPPKIESKIYAPLTQAQQKAYSAYMNHIKTTLSEEFAKNGYEKSQMKILAALTRLRQICCHPAMFIENYHDDSGKLNLLTELLNDALLGEHRILIFSQFTSMLQIIAQRLKEMQICYFYLDGNTKPELRSEYVKRFNNGENDVFLISLKAGGTGLNLTGADTVIHYDPWWNPAVEQQATDRAYRIGQNNSVQVIKLITKDTIEEKIYELQEKKQKLIDSVISSGETFINKLTQEEIKKLFEME